jgi:hypothetical protein
MSAPKPEEFPLLLEVFRDGLKRGLVTRQHVIAWADDIIKITDDPDYFFIEVSLSSDVNQLLEVLNNYSANIQDSICTRVLMSLIYYRLINDNDPVTVEEAAKLTGDLYHFDELTSFEHNNIWNFENYEYYDPTQLQVDLLDFLSTYEAFNLQNYEQWLQINIKVAEILKEKKAISDKIYEQYKITWEKKTRNQKIKKRLKLGVTILFLVGITALDLIWIDGQPPGSGNLILYGVPVFIILRLGYR